MLNSSINQLERLVLSSLKTSFTEICLYIFTFMRVLHNLTEKKFPIIITGLFFLIILISTEQKVSYAQVPDNKSGSEVDKISFSLPFNLCSEKISDKTDTQQVASDNDEDIYIVYSNIFLLSKDLKTNIVNWESNLGLKILYIEVESDKNFLYVVVQNYENKNETKTKKISKLTGITVEELPNFLENEKKETDLQKYNRLSKKVSSILVSEELLFVGNESGDIIAFETASNKKVWKGRSGGKITSITSLKGKKILISSFDNFLYMYSRRNGNLIWKKRLPNRITKKPQIYNEGIILVSDYSSSILFLLETESGKTLNQISLPDSVLITSNSIYINNKIIVPTNSGVLLYSQHSCSE